MTVGKFIFTNKTIVNPVPNPRGTDAITEEGHVSMSYRAARFTDFMAVLCLLFLTANVTMNNNHGRKAIMKNSNCCAFL